MINEIELRFQNELAKTPDPITFALTFPKRMDQALELAKTPEDANGLRALAAMGTTYLEHMLPVVITDRRECYALMYPTEAAYLDASAKAGELWTGLENRRIQGKKISSTTGWKTIGPQDVGFRVGKDSTTCERIGALDPQDLDTYKSKCIQNEDHITLSGAEDVWKSLQPKIATPREPTVPKDVLLYAGDMLDIVPTMGKFELVVTDPPYGVTDYKWDVLHTREWLEVIKPHLAQEYNLFWFCSPACAADIEMTFREFDLPIQSRIVWIRRNMAMGSKARNKFIDSWEMCLHAGNRELNFPSEWSDAWFDTQTFAVPQTNFTDQKYHPTQKPEALVQRLIEFGSFPGDHILDPFAGSGTTGAVCPDDRDCTLIEKEEDYIRIIEKRLGVIHG